MNNNLTNQDWKSYLNNLGGYTGNNNRPVDQFEWVILQALNSGKSFNKNVSYDIESIGKGFKNGVIELIKDSKRTKIFISSFHVNKNDGTDKLANVTVYKFEFKKEESSTDSKWEFINKIVVENSSEYGYPVEKLNQYISKQLEIEGKCIQKKYTKVIESKSSNELDSYTAVIETIKRLNNADQAIAILRQIFESNEKQSLTQFLLENDLLAEDVKSAVDVKKKIEAVNKYILMLNNPRTENEWQDWFKENNWLLGSEFVRIVDERRIDVSNITDYLVEAYDGFLDIIEIKKPSKEIKFWSNTKDHDNYFPHSDLIKAITQSLNYINQVEKKIDSKEFQKRVDNVSVIKPRCTLIFGRSINWNEEQKEAYRILNSSYHNITILTYDHVLERAKRMLGNGINWNNLIPIGKDEEEDFDLPF